MEKENSKSAFTCLDIIFFHNVAQFPIHIPSRQDQLSVAKSRRHFYFFDGARI
jgi:hypothetical protein